ncbi:FAD-dependent oxidoreductase [Rhodobacterales bacterium HKCCE2091]|nr:FAD-dependent oxidoreductase [Rhodobacterales bacterium HKCCE2091]
MNATQQVIDAGTGTRARPIVRVLGAGPAGLAAAYTLAKTSKASVEVLDRAAFPGGNAASFQIEGICCDLGSHRFHPVADPEVMADVKELLGDDLLLRPRHGRIRLGGRWVHFPLKPADAMRRLPPSFVASLMGDMATKPFRGKSQGEPTFSSVLNDGLGPTISDNFYFPYVRKLFGLDPDELAVTLAERRVSGSSVSKILMKMARMLPGLASPTTGKFYYPRRGFGQIVEATEAAARQHGVRFRYGAEITRIERDGGRVRAVWTREAEGEVRHESDQIFSTIPLTRLVNMIDPAPPAEILEAAAGMRFRGMILIYLVLETDQFTEYDAHYFPELSTPLSRMSEPKNYNAATEPKGVTVLCAELPSDPGDPWWDMTDEELGEAYKGWLADLDLPVTVPVRHCETRRLRQAYPVYDLGYEERFDLIDEWLMRLDGILNFGRQGLFAHDNTHHAFAMAYAAADVLRSDGGIDKDAWAAHRAEFTTHRVED